jgi:hypothetical protein
MNNLHYGGNGSALAVAERLTLGRFAHGEIDRLQAWIKSINAARGLSSNWKLVYSDPHDGSESRAFLATRLTVDGKPIRCKPDVVFRDTGTGLIVIVERKVTGWDESALPKRAWPNVRAQLWCYGWIDEWIDAPDVLMVCQFYQTARFATKSGKTLGLCLIDQVRPGWRRTDRAFHDECSRYFSDYGGKLL